MELLDIALNEKDTLISLKSDKSQNAFLLLSNSIKKVMDKLLIDGRFLIKSTIILEYSLVCSSFILAKELVSRVASIFINIILKTKDRNIIIDSVGYLTQMIPFIEDDSVFNLFSLSVSTEDDFKEMQIFLSQINLHKFLINELPTAKEINFEKERNIYTIIKNCLQNPILQKSFQKVEVLNKLIDKLNDRKNIFTSSQMQTSFGDQQIGLINEIFETLSFLIIKKHENQIQELFSICIEIVQLFSESIHSIPSVTSQNIEYFSHKYLRKYHVCVFDIIAKVIVIKNDFVNEENQDVLIKAIERIIHVFPNSTNLITAVFRVVKSSLHCKLFAKKMIGSLMSLMISLAKSNSRTAAAAASTHFLADMEITKKVSKMISDFLTKNDQYMKFYRSTFKKYLENAYVPYGGPVIIYGSNVT